MCVAHASAHIPDAGPASQANDHDIVLTVAQWNARPEGPAGEALLSGGWWRFLAAPHTYYDHRRPASRQATTPASAAQVSSISGSGSGSGSGSTADEATAGSRAAVAAGCDFSHQRDPGDVLALRDAPSWVRQRVAAMDADPAAAKVGAEAMRLGCNIWQAKVVHWWAHQ